MAKAEKMAKKKDVLRIVLEAIYWAATDGGYFCGDEEQLRLEDFPKVASTLKQCLLPKGREYLADRVGAAPYFVSVNRLIKHLRCNLGADWGRDGVFEL